MIGALPRLTAAGGRVPFWDGLGSANIPMFTRHKEV